MEPDSLELEERILRIEGKLGWREREVRLKPGMFPWALLSLLTAVLLGYWGLGLPNHFYQFVLALLFVALCYHREWLALPAKAYEWSLSLLNVAVMTLLFKLFIGGGKRFPMSWLYYPNITKNPPSDESAWIPSVSDLQLAWEPSLLAQWSIDLTVVQTFLLLITLVGALVEFQPFISLTALLLVLVSIPALVSFDWPWVFPAIIAATIGLYLQSVDVHEN